MYILHITYDYMVNGIEGESFVCRTLRAAVNKARARQLKFAEETKISTQRYVEEWDESIGYLYRKINESEIDKLIAESDGSDRMYVKISEMCESDIIEEEKMTKEEVLERLTNMELGLLGEFLTDNAQSMDFVFDSRFAYVYSPKEIADIIEEGNDEGYNITLDIPILHDEFLMVTKVNNPYSKTLEIQGVANEYEDFVSCFELDKVANYILCKDDVYKAFLKKCEEDGEIVRWIKK